MFHDEDHRDEVNHADDVLHPSDGQGLIEFGETNQSDGITYRHNHRPAEEEYALGRGSEFKVLVEQHDDDTHKGNDKAHDVHGCESLLEEDTRRNGRDQWDEGNDAGPDDRGGVLQPVALEDEVEERLEQGGYGEKPEVLPLDFLVEAENEEQRRQENGGHYEAQEDGRRGVEVFINLRGPHERHPPKNHGKDARKMNDVSFVFHTAKLRFFEIVFSKWNISARYL